MPEGKNTGTPELLKLEITASSGVAEQYAVPAARLITGAFVACADATATILYLALLLLTQVKALTRVFKP